ncbi:adenosine deaminase-like protein isoform X6 [Loxodonta africana]|uniref:adenosine deaminase-like protein isoform X6 n=1 Tax=Loxodonta africana TaxID=9785 RepID=UPI0030D125BD
MEIEEQQQAWKKNFYLELPKVELHAHLNGSISSKTMRKLIAKKPDLKIHNQMTMIDKGKKRTLQECFQMFQLIHQLTTSPEDILMVRPEGIFGKVTKDVIKEFAEDGVKYLELRSTPRREDATGRVSLLLSGCITPFPCALIIRVCEVGSLKPFYTIVPVFMGMTKKTYVESILEGIKQSKQENLDIDVRYLIAIDRRGGPSVAKTTVKMAEEFFCSTEETVLGIDLSGDPMTDDKGVFATHLSQEYQLAAETFNLTPSQVWDLSYESINYVFASDSTKCELRKKWNHLKPNVLCF